MYLYLRSNVMETLYQKWEFFISARREDS